MKIFSINTVTYGSTGRIMMQIAEIARNRGVEYFTSCGYIKKKYKSAIPFHYNIGGFLSKGIHKALARLSGFDGCYSIIATSVLLRRLNRIKPDILHLHNLHAWYINYPILFRYIKRNSISVVWTFHDCWAFTAQCPHFTLVQCAKWISGCHHCPQYRKYPGSIIDNTKVMYKLKKKWFSNVADLTIVTPSDWLARLAKKSFLGYYHIETINNGIDLEKFHPCESDYRQRYGIVRKYIVLGVALGWGERKGLDVFVDLANRLDDRFQIVLVGTNDSVDAILPGGIVSIQRTQSQQELAEIYAAADVFINPTREDNFPTVNLEALACGTPVITFDTGGSPETIDKTCGSVIKCDDLVGLIDEIKRVCLAKPYSREACVSKAQSLDMNKKFSEYISLYENIADDKRKFVSIKMPVTK